VELKTGEISEFNPLATSAARSGAARSVCIMKKPADYSANGFSEATCRQTSKKSLFKAPRDLSISVNLSCQTIDAPRI